MEKLQQTLQPMLISYQIQLLFMKSLMETLVTLATVKQEKNFLKMHKILKSSLVFQLNLLELVLQEKL